MLGDKIKGAFVLVPFDFSRFLFVEPSRLLVLVVQEMVVSATKYDLFLTL
jgi:hypothetical protein